MGYVVEKTTGKISWDVNEPNYDPSDYLVNPDLAAVNGVPERFWKVEGSDVVERTDAEKVVVDLPGRKVAFDSNTGTLIAAGFAHDGKTFSQSPEAQRTWASWGANPDALSYPYEVMTKDDTEVYSVADAAAMTALCNASALAIATHRASGKDLKVGANAATTMAELDAVVDSR